MWHGGGFVGNWAFKICREAAAHSGSAPSKRVRSCVFGVIAKRRFLETLPHAVRTAGREVLIWTLDDKTTEVLAGLRVWMPCSWPFSFGCIGESLPGLAKKLPSDFVASWIFHWIGKFLGVKPLSIFLDGILQPFGYTQSIFLNQTSAEPTLQGHEFFLKLTTFFHVCPPWRVVLLLALPLGP